MAKRCDICGKGPSTGNNISHSNHHTKRVYNVNIQRIRIIENGSKVRRKVCTKCIKSGKVVRAI
jgi:large subunit ribosomal protein L28